MLNFAEMKHEDIALHVHDLLKASPAFPKRAKSISLFDLLNEDARKADVRGKLAEAVKQRFKSPSPIDDDPRTYMWKAKLVLSVPGTGDALIALFEKDIGIIINNAKHAMEAHKLSIFGIETADYVQEFFPFFVASIEKFDQTRGVKFNTFLIREISSFNNSFHTYLKDHEDRSITNFIEDAAGSNDYARHFSIKLAGLNAMVREEEEKRLERDINELPADQNKVLKAALFNPDKEQDKELARGLGMKRARFSDLKIGALTNLILGFDPDKLKKKPKQKRDAHIADGTGQTPAGGS